MDVDTVEYAEDTRNPDLLSRLKSDSWYTASSIFGAVVLACTPPLVSDQVTSDYVKSDYRQIHTPYSGVYEEEVGTSPSPEKNNMFDYVKEEYTINDLSKDINKKARGFTKEEAEGYRNFIDSIFE
jgi:hypothetical protein